MLIPEATKKGYAVAKDGDYVNLQFPDSQTRRGRVGDQVAQTLLCNDAQGVVVKADGIYTNDSEEFHRGELKDLSRTLKAEKHDAGVVIEQRPRGFNKGGEKELCPNITTSSFQENNFVKSEYLIRKLTPKECWRLMGFTDADFDKAQKVNSNSQLYKQAGNSIVKQVLMAIFKNMI